jgi:hypothetical protein
MVFAALVIQSLMVFASARRSEGGAQAFAWTTSTARLAEPADLTFDLWNIDVEILERGGGVFAFTPTIDNFSLQAIHSA